MTNDTPEVIVIDLASFGVIIATLAGWLPAVASLLAIIWTAIRIWETKTVQDWVMKKARREARKEVIEEVVAAITPEDKNPIKSDIQNAINTVGDHPPKP